MNHRFLFLKKQFRALGILAVVAVFGYMVGSVQAAPVLADTPSAVVNTTTITDTTASISGTLMHGDDLTDITLSYGTDSKRLLNKLPMLFNDSFFSVNINGLTKDTKYFYVINGTLRLPDSQGNSDVRLQGEAYFITNVKPTNNSVYLSVVEIASTTALVMGHVPAGTTVKIMLDKTTLGVFDPPIPASVDRDGNFKLKLTNLFPSSLYNIYASRGDAINTPLTPLQTFSTTNVDVRPYVISVTDTTAKIGVRASLGVHSLVLKYGLDSEHMTKTAPLVVGSSGTEYTADLTGLTPDTAYAYALYGTRPNGTTVTYTNAYSFLTARTPIKAPVVQTMVDSGSVAGIAFDFRSLVQCGRMGPLIKAKPGIGEAGYDSKNIDVYDPSGVQACDFAQAIALISRMIDFLLFLVAPIILIITLTWAGVLILTSGGSSEKVTQAKGMIMKAVIGLVVAMAAWIIVKFVLVSLNIDTSVFPTFY